MIRDFKRASLPENRPRPASMRNFWSPASTSVQGPKRSGLGIGTPVPSSVTRKSLAVMD
jgi:hypothetical protein